MDEILKSLYLFYTITRLPLISISLEAFWRKRILVDILQVLTISQSQEKGPIIKFNLGPIIKFNLEAREKQPQNNKGEK